MSEVSVKFLGEESTTSALEHGRSEGATFKFFRVTLPITRESMPVVNEDSPIKQVATTTITLAVSPTNKVYPVAQVAPFGGVRPNRFSWSTVNRHVFQQVTENVLANALTKMGERQTLTLERFQDLLAQQVSESALQNAVSIARARANRVTTIKTANVTPLVAMEH